MTSYFAYGEHKLWIPRNYTQNIDIFGEKKNSIQIFKIWQFSDFAEFVLGSGCSTNSENWHTVSTNSEFHEIELKTSIFLKEFFFSYKFWKFDKNPFLTSLCSHAVEAQTLKIGIQSALTVNYKKINSVHRYSAPETELRCKKIDFSKFSTSPSLCSAQVVAQTL